MAAIASAGTAPAQVSTQQQQVGLPAAVAVSTPVKMPLQAITSGAKVNGANIPSVDEATRGVGKMATSLVAAGADVTPIALKSKDIVPDLKASTKAASTKDDEISYEDALKRREQKELEQAKLLCSLEK